MSHIDRSITNSQVIPSIESRLFAENPDASYAVGMIAHGDIIMPGMQDEYMGYLRLRANVYADQTQMISKELVRADGTESDLDDQRSVHFALIENTGKIQRVVAAARLIIKSFEDPRPLPIEAFFQDEAFAHAAAPLNSTEVSRYICRHEDPKIERRLKWPLYDAALGYIATHNLGPTYAVVEKFLERGLASSGIPISRIAPPKFVPEYNDDNLGIIIDTMSLCTQLGITPEPLTVEDELTNKFTFYNEKVSKLTIPQQRQAQAS